jgi:hypothetical protein
MLTLTVLKAWILAAMLSMQPNVAWKNTYEKTAEAIATEAIAYPLYPGKEDGRRTASIFLAVGFYESNFKPDAQGDCDKTNDQGMCIAGSTPHSFCTFQVSESNYSYLGVTKTQMLEDINVCTHAAGRMMHRSYDVVCAGRPDVDRLNQYATGGPRCLPSVPKGRHRVLKAQWIFGHFRLPAETDVNPPFLTSLSP